MTLIKAVCFDFDGVLIDSIEAMQIAWETVKVKFKILNSFAEYSLHIGKPFECILKELSINPHYWSEIAKVYSQAASENSDLVRLMPYAIDILDWIKSKKIKVGLVTSKNQQRTYQLLNNFNLKLDIIVTPELTFKGKPSPEPLIYASKRLEVDINNILFVGDMNSDMEAAKAAKTKYLHYNNGYQQQEFPPYGGLIHSLFEIREYIQQAR